MANEEAQYVRALLPYPHKPTCTVYSPTGTAYMKVSPDAKSLKMVVRPRVTTQALIYAPIVTHKIADTTTTISAADPTDLASSRTAADEILADCNTHIASTTYHVAAGTAFVAGHTVDDTTNTASSANMSNLATGYTLADELDDDVNAHIVSTSFHSEASAAIDFGGTPASEATLRVKVNLLRTAMIAHFGDADAHNDSADVVNAALATATTPGTDEASDQTLINLLKAYWNSHCAVGDASTDDLAAVVVTANSAKDALLAHFADTTVAHGGLIDQADYDTLAAVADASDQATANTLLHAEKDTYNAHCAIVEGGAYITAGAVGLPIDWPCLGSFFAKTDTSGGVFTVAEWLGD